MNLKINNANTRFRRLAMKERRNDYCGKNKKR